MQNNDVFSLYKIDKKTIHMDYFIIFAICLIEIIWQK